MDRSLRFCMVTTFYPPYNFGGDGIFVHRLSNELARRGHKVDVIHCRDAYRLMAGREPSQGYDDSPNVTVHGLKSPFGRISPLATQQTGRPLFKSGALRQILDREFDVIHFHNISLLGPKVLEYGRAIKFYTMHEYWLVCPTHVLFRFNRAACVRPHCFLCTLIYQRPPQWWRYSGLLAAAAKHVDAFIAPSRFSKDKHLQMGFRAEPVHIPPFVPSVAADSPMPVAEDLIQKPYFLFVGRLEKLKGLQTIIPIFRDYPKARLLIAGAGGYEAELRKLAPGNDNVRFLGYRSANELQSLYSRAVAVIMPSLCFEGFPLVVLEAYRQKIPVIVRDLGAMTEVAEDSGGGIVYQNEVELLAAMDKLLTDPGYRDTLGINGYMAYLKNWTTDAHLERYLALIRETAASRI